MKLKFLSILLAIITISGPTIAMEEDQDPGKALVETKEDIAGSSNLFDKSSNDRRPLSRAHSCEDFNKLKKRKKNNLRLPALSGNVAKSDVIQYLEKTLGKDRASEISEEITDPKGKSKVLDSENVTPKKLKQNKDLDDVKRLREENAEESKRRGTVGIEDMLDLGQSVEGSEVASHIVKGFADNVFANSASRRKIEEIDAQAAVDVIKDRKRLGTKLRIAKNDSKERWAQEPESRRLSARETAKGTIAINRQRLNLIKKHPYILIGIAGGIAASYFAAKHGMQVLFNEIQRIIGIPQLAQETSLLTFRQKIARSLGLYKEEMLKTDDVIFNPEFKDHIVKLTSSIANTVENHGYFRNLIFYGLPGTGKTLTAKMIAKNSGLDYIYFAASDLLKLKEQDALNKITELVEYSKNSAKKLMIIIDEAEELFADRGGKLTSEMKNKLNLILSRTGTESKDYFVVALTNRPQDFDEAMISRFAEHIEFPIPNELEIRKMLELYVKKFLLTPAIIKPTLYQKLFGKVTQAKRISIEPIALNNAALDNIAKKLHGFVGRDISQLVISLQAEAYATKGLRLTKKAVNEIVDQKIAQKKKAAQNFSK